MRENKNVSAYNPDFFVGMESSLTRMFVAIHNQSTQHNSTDDIIKAIEPGIPFCIWRNRYFGGNL